MAYLIHVHEQARYERQIRALEKENVHLKEVLAEMADALYSSKRRDHDLQPELEQLVILWMCRANSASLRALDALRVESRRDRSE